jgi:toxin-antitoxin system PIN domain toxin
MSDDLALVDTNILIYALYPEVEHHAASRSLLDRARSGQIGLCVVQQILAEFYAVATNPRRVTAPRRPEEVISTIENLLVVPAVTLLSTPADAVTRWLGLSPKYAVTGGATFDVQLIATMLGNGVRRIYTFNRAHFDQFEEIEVLTP